MTERQTLKILEKPFQSTDRLIIGMSVIFTNILLNQLKNLQHSGISINADTLFSMHDKLNLANQPNTNPKTSK